MFLHFKCIYFINLYTRTKKTTNPVAFFQMCFRSNQVQSFFYEKDLGYKVPLVRGRRFTAVRAVAVSSVSSRWKVTKSRRSITTASSAKRRSLGSELIRLSLRSRLHLSGSSQRQAINKYFRCQLSVSALMIEITVEMWQESHCSEDKPLLLLFFFF